MVTELGNDLKLEMDVPFVQVQRLVFTWKVCCHAVMKLEGYVKREDWGGGRHVRDHSVKLLYMISGKEQILYQGRLFHMEVREQGDTSFITAKAISASWQLDQKKESRSFQDVSKTYGQVVREFVKDGGGAVICGQGTGEAIKAPVIQNEETKWSFANRLGSRLGAAVIPDIITGRPNLWFGMREGKEIPGPGQEYHIQMQAVGKTPGTRIFVKSREAYKIGDYMVCFGHKAVVAEMEGRYDHGEMIYSYVLEYGAFYQGDFIEKGHPAGQGFWGTVREVREETIKIALDIDGGKETGDYFYPWYPETGNSLYATPEVGARGLLCFFQEGQRNGAVIHCMNKDQDRERIYTNRAVNFENGDFIDLTKGIVRISRGTEHHVTLTDGTVTTRTSGDLRIEAKKEIRLKGMQITVHAPEELNICQG